ncbi:hypothetical protein ACE02Y_10430 [Shewanella xiamenensis]|jgi:hypothetical protein|uniref:Uncharacterized protein n=2 Tax=Shewanella xiamenensis TaxID=332186 RepID=A0AAE4Q113_9GAMM|nr:MULTISPECIES: hypothetical protein [Shewanella]MCT8860679.1 hypothetical protein [Shewanella xiamenensis]MCT8862207.1 hypothetical protein [Shewanella xiamenensis]MCT8871763.1 hypothetical protein [Shewanella xiamenensis]MCT8875350.1 hypothetical protein [Shewanella xiamenensis]MDH1314700.1 hypothetical protein [Shewanella xiamenensis]
MMQLKNSLLIVFCFIALVASTQTTGLLRSLIEFSAFLGVLGLAWRIKPNAE